MALRKISPPSASGDGWYAQITSGIVFLTLTNFQRKEPLVLPEQFRPKRTQTFSNKFGNVDVRPWGAVDFYLGDYQGSVYLTMSWPVA